MLRGVSRPPTIAPAARCLHTHHPSVLPLSPYPLRPTTPAGPSLQGLARGFNRIYDTNLALSLRAIFAKHALLWAGMPPPFRPDAVPTCTTIAQFDDAITIHSFGWPSVEAYYAGSSSSLSVPHLKIPTLCIQVRGAGRCPL